MNLKEKIAAQKARLENPPSQEVQVLVGGEVTSIVLTKLRPDEWVSLVALHPPRAGMPSDKQLGMNLDTLPSDYPVDRIKVDGEAVDKEMWADIWGPMESVHRGDISAAVWGVNVWTTIQEIRAVGKARAAQSPS